MCQWQLSIPAISDGKCQVERYKVIKWILQIMDFGESARPWWIVVASYWAIVSPGNREKGEGERERGVERAWQILQMLYTQMTIGTRTLHPSKPSFPLGALWWTACRMVPSLPVLPQNTAYRQRFSRSCTWTECISVQWRFYLSKTGEACCQLG